MEAANITKNSASIFGMYLEVLSQGLQEDEDK